MPCGLSRGSSEGIEHGDRRDGAHNLAVERTRSPRRSPRALHGGELARLPEAVDGDWQSLAS